MLNVKELTALLTVEDQYNWLNNEVNLQVIREIIKQQNAEHEINKELNDLEEEIKKIYEQEKKEVESGEKDLSPRLRELIRIKYEKQIDLESAKELARDSISVVEDLHKLLEKNAILKGHTIYESLHDVYLLNTSTESLRDLVARDVHNAVGVVQARKYLQFLDYEMKNVWETKIQESSEGTQLEEMNILTLEACITLLKDYKTGEITAEGYIKEHPQDESLLKQLSEKVYEIQEIDSLGFNKLNELNKDNEHMQKFVGEDQDKMDGIIRLIQYIKRKRLDEFLDYLKKEHDNSIEGGQAESGPGSLPGIDALRKTVTYFDWSAEEEVSGQSKFSLVLDVLRHLEHSNDHFSLETPSRYSCFPGVEEQLAENFYEHLKSLRGESNYNDIREYIINCRECYIDAQINNQLTNNLALIMLNAIKKDDSLVKEIQEDHENDYGDGLIKDNKLMRKMLTLIKEDIQAAVGNNIPLDAIFGDLEEGTDGWLSKQMENIMVFGYWTDEDDSFKEYLSDMIKGYESALQSNYDKNDFSVESLEQKFQSRLEDIYKVAVKDWYNSIIHPHPDQVPQVLILPDERYLKIKIPLGEGMQDMTVQQCIDAVALAAVYEKRNSNEPASLVDYFDANTCTILTKPGYTIEGLDAESKLKNDFEMAAEHGWLDVFEQATLEQLESMGKSFVYDLFSKAMTEYPSSFIITIMKKHPELKYKEIKKYNRPDTKTNLLGFAALHKNEDVVQAIISEVKNDFIERITSIKELDDDEKVVKIKAAISDLFQYFDKAEKTGELYKDNFINEIAKEHGLEEVFEQATLEQLESMSKQFVYGFFNNAMTSHDQNNFIIPLMKKYPKLKYKEIRRNHWSPPETNLLGFAALHKNEDVVQAIISEVKNDFIADINRITKGGDIGEDEKVKQVNKVISKLFEYFDKAEKIDELYKDDFIKETLGNYFQAGSSTINLQRKIAHYKERAFFNAIRYNNREVINKLLKNVTLNKYNINGFHGNKSTPLHYACKWGNEKMVAVLIKKLKECKKIDALYEEYYSGTPLRNAIDDDNLTITQLLIDPLQPDDLGKLANTINAFLSIAIKDGRSKVKEYMIKLIKENRVQFGSAPLYKAVYNGEEEVVKELIKDFPEMIYQPAPNGKSPIQAAHNNMYTHFDNRVVSNRIKKIIDSQVKKDLLDAVKKGDGKKIDEIKGAVCLNGKVYIDILTPDDIIQKSDEELVKIINELEKKIKPTSKKEGLEQDTLLHLALKNKKTETAKYLIKNLPVESLFEVNKDGNTPLHLAIINKETEIMQLLIEKLSIEKLSIEESHCKALYKANEGGKTPLNLAVEHNEKEVLQSMKTLLGEFYSKAIDTADARVMVDISQLTNPSIDLIDITVKQANNLLQNYGFMSELGYMVSYKYSLYPNNEKRMYLKKGGMELLRKIISKLPVSDIEHCLLEPRGLRTGSLRSWISWMEGSDIKKIMNLTSISAGVDAPEESLMHKIARGTHSTVWRFTDTLIFKLIDKLSDEDKLEIASQENSEGETFLALLSPDNKLNVFRNSLNEAYENVYSTKLPEASVDEIAKILNDRNFVQATFIIDTWKLPIKREESSQTLLNILSDRIKKLNQEEAKILANTKDKDGKTLIYHLAEMEGGSEIMRIIRKQLADHEKLNIFGEDFLSRLTDKPKLKGIIEADTARIKARRDEIKNLVLTTGNSKELGVVKREFSTYFKMEDKTYTDALFKLVPFLNVEELYTILKDKDIILKAAKKDEKSLELLKILTARIECLSPEEASRLANKKDKDGNKLIKSLATMQGGGQIIIKIMQILNVEELYTILKDKDIILKAAKKDEKSLELLKILTARIECLSPEEASRLANKKDKDGNKLIKSLATMQGGGQIIIKIMQKLSAAEKVKIFDVKLLDDLTAKKETHTKIKGDLIRDNTVISRVQAKIRGNKVRARFLLSSNKSTADGPGAHSKKNGGGK